MVSLGQASYDNPIGELWVQVRDPDSVNKTATIERHYTLTSELHTHTCTHIYTHAKTEIKINVLVSKLIAKNL